MATQIKQKNTLTLQDENSFEFLSGLWTGKKPPYTKAVVIRNTNFSNDGKIDYSNIAVLDVEAKQLQSRKLEKGDIIIERSGGGPKQPVGRVVYFDKETSEIDYSFSNFTSTIRVKDKQNFDSRYVFYFLYNFYAEGNTDHLQRRTTGIRNLDFSSYKESVIFPSISISEQKAVAQALLIVQDAIAEQEKVMAKLKELKRSMVQHLFTHGTKGEKTKMTEFGEIPESWEMIKLGDVVNFTTGKLNANAMEPGGIYPFFTCSQDNYQINSYAFDCEALLLSGNNARAVYSVKYYKGKFNAYQRTYIITLKNKQDSYSYMRYMLEMNLSRLQSISIGSSTKYLTLGLLTNLPIFKPDHEEQQKIGSAIDSINNKIDSTQEKLSAYQNLFKTLLHELMSGERRIKNI